MRKRMGKRGRHLVALLLAEKCWARWYVKGRSPLEMALNIPFAWRSDRANLGHGPYKTGILSFLVLSDGVLWKVEANWKKGITWRRQMGREVGYAFVPWTVQ